MTYDDNSIRLERQAFLKYGTLVLTAASLSTAKLLADNKALFQFVGEE